MGELTVSGSASGTASRTAALARAGLLSPAVDEAFDRLTRLAAELTGAPFALVTLVDDERALWKSVHGLEAPAPRDGAHPTWPGEAPAGWSLCELVIEADDPVLVDDAGTHEPSRATPAVAELGIRSWAGFPVRDPSGLALGVLCVLDTVARPWTPHHRDVLASLAQAGAGEIALRTALQESRAAEAELAGRVTASERRAVEAEERARGSERRMLESDRAAERSLAVARESLRRATDSDEVAAGAEQLARLAEEHAAEVDELAATLRESLLPARLPDFPGLEVAARYAPGTGGSVLGDFYDLFPTPQGWGVVIGDVCGKGAQAARTTALARSTVRALGHTDDDPQAVLAHVDGVLRVWFDGRPTFVSCAYVSFAPRAAGGLYATVASAGHEPGVVHRRDGSVEVLAGGGCVLGVRDEPRIAREEIVLDAGDRLVLYTDGLSEARPYRGPQLEVEGIVAVLGSLAPGADSATVVDALEAARRTHADGAAADDLAVVAVRPRR